jgi:hypothetical protein
MEVKMEQIQVTIEGKPYSVIGGEFYAMLNAVKDIPGCAYRNKVWELPCLLDEARVALAPLQVVDEDGLLEAEIADIQRIQAQIVEMRSRIEWRISVLDQDVRGYSRNSKSSIKYGLASKSSLLGYALQYASVPVEKLTEPQIKTLYAAAREMEK